MAVTTLSDNLPAPCVECSAHLCGSSVPRLIRCRCTGQVYRRFADHELQLPGDHGSDTGTLSSKALQAPLKLVSTRRPLCERLLCERDDERPQSRPGSLDYENKQCTFHVGPAKQGCILLIHCVCGCTL